MHKCVHAHTPLAQQLFQHFGTIFLMLTCVSLLFSLFGFMAAMMLFGPGGSDESNQLVPVSSASCVSSAHEAPAATPGSISASGAGAGWGVQSWHSNEHANEGGGQGKGHERGNGVVLSKKQGNSHHYVL